MQHAAFVCRGQSGAELSCDVERLVLGQPADASQQRGHILAVDVLHRQEGQAVGLADAVHPADVLVRDLAGEPHLVVELGQAHGIAFERRRQELQRERLPEFEVVGPIDLAHAALPESRDDAIPLADHSAGLETAVVHPRRRQPS